MKVNSFFKSSLIALALLCLSPFVKAQPGGSGGDPDPGGAVPFDLGISVFVAAGIGYAAKKKHDARKKENITDDAEK